MSKGYKRYKYNYLIKKNLQGKLTWQFFLLTLAGLFAFIGILSVISTDHLTISYDHQQLQVGSTSVLLLKETIRSNWIFLLTAGLAMVMAFIVITHKIAGPIYRFESVTRQMCERKLDQQIYLRKGDEGRELADSINLFNQTLSSDIRTLLHNSTELELALSQQNLKTAAQHNRQIQELLNRYRLTAEQKQS